MVHNLSTNKKISTLGLSIKKNPFYSFLPAAPATIFLIYMFGYPVILLLLRSFLCLDTLTVNLEHFRRLMDAPIYVRVIWDTLVLSFSVAIWTFVLGYPVAYFISSAPTNRVRFYYMLVLLPFWTSILVRTYAWMIILGRTGVINQLLLQLRLTDTPLPLMYNFFGVNVGMVQVLLPFMILPLYNVMKRIDMDLFKAAEVLGASKFRAFLYVYFPLTLPGVIAGSLLVFILSIGFFVTPALLGGGKVMMIAPLIEQLINRIGNWGLASALSLILVVIVLIVFYLYNRILGWEKSWV